jgi:hypothetical protein
MKFRYSTTHDWQRSSNVKQVLVFTSAEDRDNFEDEFLIKDDCFPHTVDHFKDADVKGVHLKLRAVLDGDDLWIPLIRKPDGTLVKEYSVCFDKYEQAIHFLTEVLELVA